MKLTLRTFLFAMTIGFTLVSPVLWATDFTCVENYREWSSSFFDKPAQPPGSTAGEREDAHRIWLIYRDIGDRRYQTEEVRGMLRFLAVPPEKEIRVMTEFVRLLESGEVCEDDKPAKSWVDVLNTLKPYAN